MKRGKARSTGTVLAAVAMALSAGYFIFAGVLTYLMPSLPVPGGIAVMIGMEVVGFGILTLAAGVFMMWSWSRKPTTLVAGLLTVGFAYVGATTFTVAEPATVINVLMAVNNALAAVALLVSEDIVVDEPTDTSEKHATDIGTGYR